MRSKILLTLLVLTFSFITSASDSSAAIPVSSVPDITNPAPGESIGVQVHIDLSGEEDFLFGSIIDQNTGDNEQGKLIVITFYLEPYDVEKIFLALDRGLLNLSILPKTNPVSF